MPEPCVCQNTPSLPISAVHANKLVVLRNDFLLVVVVKDKILNVIEKSLWRKQTRDHRFQTRAPPFNFLAVNFLFLVLSTEPYEEMLPLGCYAADLGLDCVREDAKGVREEKLRDFPLIVRDVIVKTRDVTALIGSGIATRTRSLKFTIQGVFFCIPLVFVARRSSSVWRQTSAHLPW